MNFAKKSAALVLSAVMLVTSLAVGTTTAFAANEKKSFAAMNSSTQTYAANVTDDQSNGYHNYTVKSYSYYTFTPSSTGYYALSVASTPVYRNEVVKTYSDGTTYTTKEYSYTAGQNAVRVDNASVSIYEKFNAATDELKDSVGYAGTFSYETGYKQSKEFAYPEAVSYNYYNGYDTVKLIAGQTYYIEAYTDYNSNYVNNQTDERIYFTGAAFSIVPTDWTVSFNDDKVSSQKFTVKDYDGDVYESTYTVYSPYAEVTYVGAAKDAVVPDVINNISVKTVNGTENKEITSLTLANSVKNLSGFSNLKSLASVNLASVEKIGNNCFANDTALTAVTIPASVKSVESGAFYNCTALSNAVITNGVKTIGSYAFYNTALKAAVIPASVTSIGSYAFGYVENLDTNTVMPYDTTETLVDGFVMGGYSSEAGTYAAVNGIAYYDMTAGCPHPYVTTTVAATLFAKGKKTSVCPLCGATVKKSIAKKTFKIKSLKSSKKGTIAIKAAKQAGITGYQVQYSTSSKFTKKTTKTVTVKTTKALSKTIKGLKSGKKYYVRVRAYNKANGKTVYSKFTAVKSVKVK